MKRSVSLDVISLAGIDLDDWNQIKSGFRNARVVESQQAWQAARDPEFRPMHVKAGWTREALIVYAVLEDADIFNPETQFNAMSFKSGDVFEMFLRPFEQEAYLEVHVSPENQKLQLRFPSAQAFAAPRPDSVIPPEWYIGEGAVESYVRVDKAAERWEVVARIPFSLVEEASRPVSGSRWLFSFSRYDYTRGRKAPVYSSTSPHTRLSFHQQEAWGELTFL
ncbi:MAG: carbohydrate-binding family 9-like protein [bacterium]|jgi:hypothetical protein